MGRFASPDTIVPDPTDPQSFNRYSYVNNDPINYTDPSGHCRGSYNPETGQATEDGGCWDFLYNEFCSGGGVAICSNWIERLSPFVTCLSSACSLDFGSGYWTSDELRTLRDALGAAIMALNGAGFDGAEILSGIAYRRIHGGDSFVFPAGTINLSQVNEQIVWHETGHAISFRNWNRPQNEYYKFAAGFASTDDYDLSDFCYRDYCGRNYFVVNFYTGVNPEYWADGFAVWTHNQTYGVFPNWPDPLNPSRVTNWDLLDRAASWSLTVTFGH